MALRARRPGATTAPQGTVEGAGTAPVQTAPPVQQPVYEAPPATQTYEAPPATQTYEAPPAQQPVYNPPVQTNTQVPAHNVAPNALADLNAGILENVDDLTGGGNYVTVDGSEFLYKDTNEMATEIQLVVSAGKRFYQWVDESDPENKQFHNSDTKLDSRYKLKFELRWFEDVDGTDTEYIMSLSTTSAIQFINYVTGLVKLGLGVGQVVTKLTISRQESKNKERYSRVEFENLGLAQ